MRRNLTPYGLIAPASVLLALIMGYPLVRLIVLSFQNWGLKQIYNPDAGPEFAGLANYRRLLDDSFFWTVVARSVLLTAVMVIGSMAAGVGIALVMRNVPGWCRWLVTLSLVVAWAVPHVVSTEMFAWLTDYNFGVVNWLLGIPRHNWYVNNVEGFGVASAVVIWGAVPLIAISTYAALTQVPAELVEAARVDGASSGQVLRRIVMPLIRPILALLTMLSVIWDFQVFSQIWVLRQGNPTNDYFTLGIYAYAKAYYSHQYGFSAAVAIVIMLMLGGAMALYLRSLARLSGVDE
jgi:N,N'-diacetylchitobiose transport system permease protein